MSDSFYQKMISEPEKTLNKVFRDAVREELLSFKLTYLTPTTPIEVEYLSRKEAAWFLKISLTQLYYLQKKGTVNFYRIGSKIFFKKEDLLKSLIPSKSLNEGGGYGK